MRIEKDGDVMPVMIQAMTEKEAKSLSIAVVRKGYIKLAELYTKMIENDILLCPKCNSWVKADGFYSDSTYATGRFPICKKCLLQMVEQRKDDRSEPDETKESVQKVLHMMNKVYDDKFYEDCVKGALDDAGQKTVRSPFMMYITAIQSLPQWKGLTWDDSNFGDSIPGENDEDINENSRVIKAARKRFGRDYSLQDLHFLETQYEDWVQRYACESKAQEILFQRIAFTQLAIEKAQKSGKDTKELDKTLQDLMSSNSIKPNQNSANALTEAKSFGQLIQKWEDEKPIPEPEGDFKDVDKIGLYIDVFFKGHLSKMMGLKNAFSSLYDRFMSKYTVKKPEYQEDTDSEELFDQIFGQKLDEV